MAIGLTSRLRRAGRLVRHRARWAADLALVRVSAGRSLTYIGWLSHSNMGDEGLFGVCRSQLPSHRLVQARPGRWMDLARRLMPDALARGAVLGGGTLIGEARYREPLEQLRAWYPELPMFAAGTGVEDPDFAARWGPEAADELIRWRPLLRSFVSVGVRGPRSVEILGDLGVLAEMIGDPGLLLTVEPGAVGAGDGLVGINVGDSPRMWGGTRARDAIEVLASVGRSLAGQGWRIRCVPMWGRDVSLVEELAAQIGAAAHVLRTWQHLPRLAAGIAECQAFIGMKLHSVVFASANHVPSVMIEYQPKCLDFQRSIGREGFTVRIDQLDAGNVLAMVDDLVADGSAHRLHLARAVGILQERLRRYFSGLDRRLWSPQARVGGAG